MFRIFKIDNTLGFATLEKHTDYIEELYLHFVYWRYQHKFCLIGVTWESDYAINCWKHLQAPQMMPSDADSSER